mgnify:FL=1
MKINKPLAAALAAAGLGYAIGNLNPAYVMGLRKGYDIRKKGSGNAGATNLMILEGKKAGAFVMCFDISKAAVSVGLARKLFLQSGYAGEAAGVGCILGHMYPALMHFRGGKGLACLGGVILAFGVHDFLTTLFLESVLLMATRYLCLVPITGSVFYPIYHGIERGDWRAAAILGLITLPILSKHIENLERIKQGKELKLDFLWDKDGELDRIGYVESEF